MKVKSSEAFSKSCPQGPQARGPSKGPAVDLWTCAAEARKEFKMN
jgi:hypothetical protein